ncbi:unnamed protein product [Boreogadus saida]
MHPWRPHGFQKRIHGQSDRSNRICGELLMHSGSRERFHRAPPGSSLVLDQERVELTEHPVYATVSGWDVSPCSSLGVGVRWGRQKGVGLGWWLPGCVSVGGRLVVMWSGGKGVFWSEGSSGAGRGGLDAGGPLDVGLGGVPMALLVLCDVLGWRLRATSFSVFAKVGTSDL